MIKDPKKQCYMFIEEINKLGKNYWNLPKAFKENKELILIRNASKISQLTLTTLIFLQMGES